MTSSRAAQASRVFSGAGGVATVAGCTAADTGGAATGADDSTGGTGGAEAGATVAAFHGACGQGTLGILCVLVRKVREPANASPVALASLQCRRLAETTPDLVLDLPARAEPITPADAPLESTSAAVLTSAPATASAPASADATPVDTADTFVHNRDTLKKRPAHKHSNSDCSGDNRSEGEASNEIPPDTERTETNPDTNGSPVPARNTARVAAKFADLTLTGGSLKPALAAKPALLRRPTPHPQHAKTNSAPAGGQINPPSDSTC